MESIIASLVLFLVAAGFEVGGGYLIWHWLRENRGVLRGLIGGAALFVYGVIATFQPAHFGRVYAAYGGIFIVVALLWGTTVDKKRPDRPELIGALIALIGAAVIFYAPR